MKQTIAQIARKYMIDNEIIFISYGDLGWLDDIADNCKHTTLMKAHPLDRHIRLLNALDKSPLFEKRLTDKCNASRPTQLCREFILKEIGGFTQPLVVLSENIIAVKRNSQ